MLISYSHEFVFIHVYKVAGTSISKALQEYTHKPENFFLNLLLRKLGVKAYFPYYKYKTFQSHVTANEVRESVPEYVYNKFFKFAFVRNPWDWQVSLYHFMLQDPTHFQHSVTKSMQSFDEYIRWRVNYDKRLQKDFVTDNEGKLIVDFVGRFENLTEDFQHVSKILKLQASLPHVNKSSHRDYRSYYNEKTIKIIEEHFKEDIEFFGYSF